MSETLPLGHDAVDLALTIAETPAMAPTHDPNLAGR
jgi:hypothetical protein